jgi:cellulose biosynthesis protein BcsQ
MQEVRGMSQIHFIGGEKGGVGKSVLSRLLAQYHIDRGLPFQAFDTDRSHGAMLCFYAGYSHPIALDEFSSADQRGGGGRATPGRACRPGGADVAAAVQMDGRE